VSDKIKKVMPNQNLLDDAVEAVVDKAVEVVGDQVEEKVEDIVLD